MTTEDRKKLIEIADQLEEAIPFNTNPDETAYSMTIGELQRMSNLIRNIAKNP